jgi:hypothetical protein
MEHPSFQLPQQHVVVYVRCNLHVLRLKVWVSKLQIYKSSSEQFQFAIQKRSSAIRVSLQLQTTSSVCNMRGGGYFFQDDRRIEKMEIAKFTSLPISKIYKCPCFGNHAKFHYAILNLLTHHRLGRI